MLGKNKKRERTRVREQHPDPLIELRIQHILTLRRQVRACEEQVALYQEIIERAGRDAHDAAYELSMGDTRKGEHDAVVTAVTNRTKQAEDGIATVRQQMSALMEDIERRVAQLSADDLSFLDLSED